MQLKKLLIRPTKVLALVGAIAYPVLVFVALRSDVSVRMLGLGIICLVLLSIVRHKNILLGVCGIVLAALAFISDKEIFLKLYPVVMNCAICMMFALSLRETPLIQRIAQKMHYEMNEKSIDYSRRVTIVWAIFMGINTLVSLGTVFMPDWVWTLYNGLISYCLIGLVMGIEYLVRIRVMHANR